MPKKVASYFKFFFSKLENSDFFSSNLRFSPYVIVKLVSSPLRTKVSALSMGAASLGHWGTIQNFHSIGVAITSLGISPGLNTEVSKHFSTNNQKALQETIGAALTTLVVASLIAMLSLFVASSSLSHLIVGSAEKSYLILLVILTLPLYVLNSAYLEPIIYGIKEDAASATAYKAYSIADAIMFILLVYFLSLLGAVLSLFLSILFLAIRHAIHIKKVLPEIKLFKLKGDFLISKELIKTGSIALSTGAITYATALGIRLIISKFVGEVENGHFQAVIGLSSLYAPFITSGIWVKLFPKVSSEGLSESSIVEIGDAMLYIGVFVAFAQVVILTSTSHLIQLLYTKDFISAANLLPLRLAGDFFFFLSQPILASFLAIKNRTAYLGLIASSQLGYIIASYYLIQNGLHLVNLIHFISNLLLFLVCLIWFHKQSNRSQRLKSFRNNLFLILISLSIFLSTQIYLATYQESNIFYRSLLLVLFALFLFYLLARGWIHKSIEMRRKINGHAN